MALIITTHAVVRYRLRSGRSDATEADMKRSFEWGEQVNRQEAEAIIEGLLKPRLGDRFFRSDGTGVGVWVAFWGRNGNVRLLTYMAPGYEWDDSELEIEVELVAAVG